MSAERQIFCNSCLTAHGRERSDGLYRVITYLCAKMLDELIVAAVVSFFLACILFYGINFPGELVLFWLVYLTSLAIGIGNHTLPHSALRELNLAPDLYLSQVILQRCVSVCQHLAHALFQHMAALPYAEGCTAGALKCIRAWGRSARVLCGGVRAEPGHCMRGSPVLRSQSGLAS